MRDRRVRQDTVLYKKENIMAAKYGTSRISRKFFRTFLRGFAILVVITGCQSLEESESFSVSVDLSSCGISSDQEGTFSGKWQMPTPPVRIVLYETATDRETVFTLSERVAILNAVKSWNRVVEGRGFLFDLGSNHPSQIYKTSVDGRAEHERTCGTADGNPERARTIVVYRDRSWKDIVASEKSVKDESTVALASICYTGKKPDRTIRGGYVEVNFRDYFVDGKPVPDLESTMLHELGHVLGLDHSCSMSGGKGVPNCQDESVDPAYRDAILYPAISFYTRSQDQVTRGERRRMLQTNDRARASCLY